jgi:hypothetical protein
MKLLYALLTAALFTTAACGKKKDEPAKTEPAAKTTEPAKTEPAKTEPGKPGSAYTVDEAGAVTLPLSDKIAKAIEDGGTDCAKMGTNLKGLTEEVKAHAVLEKDFNKDAAKKAEFDKKYGPQLEAKLKEPVKKLQSCMSNADVKAFADLMSEN